MPFFGPNPPTLKEIVQFRNDIKKKKTRDEKLQAIAKFDPIQTIPVIIDIIQDALKITRKSNELAETSECLNYVLSYLKQINTDQMAGITKSKAILEKYKGKLVSELKGFVERIKKIQLSQPALELSIEMEVWLEGWYYRTKNAYDKKHNDNKKTIYKGAELIKICDNIDNIVDDPIFETIDLEDSGFNLATGSTKLNIAVFYHRAAIILANKIQQLQQQIQEAKVVKLAIQQPQQQSPVDAMQIKQQLPPQNATTQQETNPLITKTNVDTQATTKQLPPENNHSSTQVLTTVLTQQKESKIDELSALNRLTDDLADLKNALSIEVDPQISDCVSVIKQNDKFTLTVNTDNQEMLNELLDVIKSLVTPKEENLVSVLVKMQDENESVRLSTLAYAITKYGLNDDQTMWLGQLKNSVESALEGYKNSSYVKGIPLLSTIRDLVYERPNAQIANELLETIAKAEPVEVLNSLFETRKRLIGNNSVELLDTVTKLMNDAYTMLAKSKPDSALRKLPSLQQPATLYGNSSSQPSVSSQTQVSQRSASSFLNVQKF